MLQITVFVSNQADELHTISYTWREVTPEALANIATKLPDLVEKWMGEMDQTTYASLIGIDLSAPDGSGSLQHIQRDRWDAVPLEQRPLVLAEALDRLYVLALEQSQKGSVD